MIDTLIRGDRVATLNGVGAWDVAVVGEKVVAVAAPGAIDPGIAKRVIDARGKVVVPGGIDPHMHCKFQQPLGNWSSPPEHVSRAALHGGTTTIIDFAIWERGETLAKSVEKRDADCWRGQCYMDYAFHLLLTGKLPPEVIDELPDMIRAGYPSVKIFTSEVRPERSNWKVDHGDIWEVFQVLAKHNGIACIHGEDNDLVMHLYEKYIREGKVAFHYMPEVHTALSEDLSFRRIIRLAASVPQASVYFMHVSAKEGVEAIEEARARGLPIYGEALHQYAMFSSEDYKRPNGQIYHTYPALRTKTDHGAMWNGMLNGAITSIATDGLCTPFAIKTMGKRIDDTTGGSAGCEPRVSVMFTETVVRRQWPLELFVDLVSGNAARLFGLYPTKGVIAPGSDADITVLDPTLARALKKEDLHESDYSAWEGYEVAAWPSLTMLRGKVVVEGTRFLGDKTDGQQLKRKVSENILTGPRGGRG